MELRAGLMPGCPLLPFDTVAGRCAACGESLIGRQTRWCSKDCRLIYERNHYWGAARQAAIVRDGRRCVRCGWGSEELYAYLTRGGQFVLWSRAHLLRYRPDNWLEVNHIIPRLGAGYGTGCWHHLENLQTLCHQDHVRVTNRQRINREAVAAIVLAMSEEEGMHPYEAGRMAVTVVIAIAKGEVPHVRIEY